MSTLIVINSRSFLYHHRDKTNDLTMIVIAIVNSGMAVMVLMSVEYEDDHHESDYVDRFMSVLLVRVVMTIAFDGFFALALRKPLEPQASRQLRALYVHVSELHATACYRELYS